MNVMVIYLYTFCLSSLTIPYSKQNFPLIYLFNDKYIRDMEGSLLCKCYSDRQLSYINLSPFQIRLTV